MTDRFALLSHDLQAVVSSFRRRRLYAVMAIGMLALGIGANVAVFSVIRRTLLRPLHYRQPEQLVSISSAHVRAGGQETFTLVGPLEFVQWRARARLFSGIEAAFVFPTAMTGSGDPESVDGAMVSGGIFRLLGVSPMAGRDFSAEDDRPEARTMIISHGLWQRRFGGDRKAIGRTTLIDGKPMSIIGVMPQDFEMPLMKADVFIPAGLSVANTPTPKLRQYNAYGRLKSGVSIQQGAADLKQIARQLEKDFPDSQKDFSTGVKTLRDAAFGDRRSALLVLWIAVALVHLLACVNVANLMFAQISDQSGVTALRLALGAERWQVVRYRLIESLVIAFSGAAIGFLLGAIGLRLILLGQADPKLISVPADGFWVMPAFVIVVTLLTTLLVALVPALRETGIRISTIINEGSQRASSSVRSTRARELFIVAEVALAIPLLLAAAATVKRFNDLQRVNIGFEPAHVYTSQIILPSRYGKKDVRAAFVKSLMQRVDAIPGVMSAAVTTNQFTLGSSPSTVFQTDRSPEFVGAALRRITPPYFRTMKIAVQAGRAFTEQDSLDSPPVAIVDEALARQFWPGENPIGKRIHRTAPTPWSIVVGVVPSVRDNGARDDNGPTIYLPYLQNNGPYVSLVVRAAGDPMSIRKPMRDALRSVDGNLALAAELPLQEIVEGTKGGERLQVSLLSGFALVAILLAAVGIFAVTSYSVSQRMREVGVRLAFGASHRIIVRELVGQSFRSVSAGVAIGALLAIIAGRLSAFAAYGGAQLEMRYAVPLVIILLCSALLASLVPALRTRRISPNILLRDA
ncbi:MAG: ABC transporter permease [Acidobacteriota bacterium]